MFRFRVCARWYLLPLRGGARPHHGHRATGTADVTVKTLLIIYLTAYLPALLFQFVSTNWWEETVWLGFFQGPSAGSVRAMASRAAHDPVPSRSNASRWCSAAP